MSRHSAMPLRLKEPVWQPHYRLSRSVLPQKYLPWLLDQSSLTQRIVALCPGQFHVQLINQKQARPMVNEMLALNMRSGIHANVRHVYLLCDGTPWVFARTVIPPQTLTGPRRRLAHLRSRSLGAMLFSDPSMRRGELEIARLTAGEKLFTLAVGASTTAPEEIWGRRSLYWLQGNPLLVAEFFLPDIAGFLP